MLRYTPCKRQGGEEEKLLLILDFGTRWEYVVNVKLGLSLPPGK
jgi:hypothetical protein